MWKFALILFFLGSVGVSLAQGGNPTVEIVLSQPTAQMGQTVTAEVYVRGAVNIAGTDVGITVDPTCLRIVDRQTGEFLPIEAEQGGFSAFSELHDHDTRLAASLLKRSRIANGDGVFFRVTLQVICESGTAPLNVVFAELTGIEDLTVENANFLVYKLDTSNVNVINTQLAIGPLGSVTAVVPNTPDGQLVTAAPNTPDGQVATVVPSTSPDAVVTDTQQSPIVMIVVVGLSIVGVIMLGVIFWYMRRRKNEDQE